MSEEKAFRGRFEIGSFDSRFAEYGLCLCAHRVSDDLYLPSGTAVMVGPGIAMTARHVIEDFFREYDNRKFVRGKFVSPDQGTFWLIAVHPSSGAEWAVDLNFFLAEEGPDIAFLYIRPENDIAKKRMNIFAPINLNLPMVGEKIVGYGFVDAQDYPGKGPAVSFGNGSNQRLLAYSFGLVSELHENYRDKSRMKFPCFRTNARFDGGMSGGPVFNYQGEVVGLICSSLPPADETEEHVSYATLIWTSMLIMLRIPFAELPERYPALLLGTKGIMKIIGWDRCVLVGDCKTGYSQILIRK